MPIAKQLEIGCKELDSVLVYTTICQFSVPQVIRDGVPMHHLFKLVGEQRIQILDT
jgi:hypothetical protein